jgi:hypothetical protein
MVVNGVPLGRRPDGTVDHEAAQRLLQRVSCKDIVSIHFVKAEQALMRFGPGANRGAMLIATAPSNASVQTGGR